MQPKKTKAIVVSKANLSGQVWEVKLRLLEPMTHEAGQYVSLKVNDEGLRRSYSVASCVGSETVDLIVDVSPMGVGSQYILSLKVGDEVEVMGFMGRFVVEKQSLTPESQVLMMATGTGVAPMWPMLKEILVDMNFKGKVRLVWGMRHEEDLYWQDIFLDLVKKFGNFEYHLVLSKPKEDWKGERGHVGDVLVKLNGDWNNTEAYLCGANAMISEMEEKLRALGVAKVYYEKFF